MNDDDVASTCPRCSAAFDCGMNAAAPCPCRGIALDATTLAVLRARYAGCLCLACLRALSLSPPAAPAATPQRGG